MASGDTLAVWDATGGIPPSSGYATLDVRNEHVVLDFDKGVNESSYLVGVLPRNYAGGGLALQVEFITSTTTGNTVVWAATFERHQPGADDLDQDNFGTTVTGSADESTTAGVTSVATLTFSAPQAGNPQPGESYRVRLTRDATGAFQSGDDCQSDAELVSVELREA